VISTHFVKRAVRMSLYFYEWGASFKKGWEPVV